MQKEEKVKLPWKSNEAAGDRYYGDIAKNYLRDRVDKFVWKRENEIIKEYLWQLNDVSRLLDIPFGTGRFASLYKEKNICYYGVDASRDMLSVARAELGPLYLEDKIKVGMANNLPFSDDFFDAVVSIRFLESIIPFEQVSACLCEMRRVSKKYGIFLLKNRLDEFPPAKPPAPGERMDSKFYLKDVSEIISKCGWQIYDSKIIAQDNDKKGEKRIYLLKTGH